MRRVLIACGLIALGAPLPSPAEAQAPSFAGTWKLNEKESDDPAEQFRKAMERETAPTEAEGFNKDRRRGPPPVRPAGGAPTGGPSAGPRDACAPMAQLRQPAQDLVIEQTDSVVTLKGGSCPPDVLYLDGRTTTEPFPTGGTMTSEFSYKDGKLRVERKAGSMQVRETYTLDPKKGLVAEFLINAEQMPKALRMKLVYEKQ